MHTLQAGTVHQQRGGYRQPDHRHLQHRRRRHDRTAKRDRHHDGRHQRRGGVHGRRTYRGATLVNTDTTTQGNWKTVYGADGQAVSGDVTKYPSYAQVAFSGQATYTWAGTTDVRAPMRVATTGRIASVWYASTNFSIDINLTDGLAHRVALYCLDWDGANTRAERIDVLDAATGLVLASSTMGAFSAGQYLVWNLSGHVTLRVTRTGAMNGVVSGVFFNWLGGCDWRRAGETRFRQV